MPGLPFRLRAFWTRRLLFFSAHSSREHVVRGTADLRVLARVS